MYEGLIHAHSILRWVVLLLIILTIFSAIGGLSGNKVLTASDKKLSFFALLSTHLQAVLGLVLYFLSPKVQFSDSTMGNSMLRFFTMEHTVMMLIAIILVTLGNRWAKQGNARKVFWYYFIALLIILAAIPWPFREMLGSHWF
ncbi:MAG: cytochrome B [Bacteroidota bacterium]|nr:cytochrome B [Bacteroidota bacterium]